MSLRQESIVRWVNQDYLVKPYFYLDWDVNEMLPKKQATWVSKKPENVSWLKVAKVGYREISLCSSYKHTSIC